ncbi:GmrSD restriction endonuclease domain-containing protein [Rhodanobacter spathiphylli]|uniref:GmrSD restriction endonucleases N-terminal domain-containing protein n=1 Tax=Rhodanobacter spathiphylli B39 TaxID=1163407 RepID=I4W2I3_9GAMM|nr:DUF262 domain-containing protein [Rhodanobacter spathiphylli]EIL93674.1 hypothetical protein UU7_07521 [Rhodanobacter spathiphylli B39]
MFDTTKEDLKDILRKVNEGKLQLPDFQRDYVWGDEDVRSLIASIAKGFPVGALLTLETGGEVEFKPRVLEGVEVRDVRPTELLLDGQQRMTSLFQAAFAKAPVRTRNVHKKLVERLYYIDIKKAAASKGSLEDAIIGVPADRIVRTNFGKTIDLDVSTRDREFELDLFPLNQVFDSRDWFYDWRDFWRAKGRDITELDRDFVRTIVDSIERYKMPIIRLDRNNKREAICVVFEKVNVGGKKLDAFELVTAIYAAEKFDLREDWNGTKKPAKAGRHSRMIGAPNPRDVLTQIANTDFLQACTLLHTRDLRLQKAAEGAKDGDLPQISCKRDALLGLPLHAYQKHADAVESGFIEAGGFLNELKIIWHKDISYPPLVVGLAAIFAILGKDAQTAKAKQQLAQWFWSVTLGELFGSSTESRLARDVPEVVDWIKNPVSRPRTLDEAVFQAVRLRSLRSRQSAAYKGLHALLMKGGCRDFITGRPTDLMTFFNDDIDIHHVFPQAWCKKQGIEKGVFDAIINKTPLSKLSNISVSGDAPSVYLKRIEDKQGISSDDLDAILRTHLIEPAHLRADDFKAFYEARSNALAELVAGAMQKPVVVEAGTNEVEQEDDSMEADEELEAA